MASDGAIFCTIFGTYAILFLTVPAMIWTIGTTAYTRSYKMTECEVQSVAKQSQNFLYYSATCKPVVTENFIYDIRVGYDGTDAIHRDNIQACNAGKECFVAKASEGSGDDCKIKKCNGRKNPWMCNRIISAESKFQDEYEVGAVKKCFVNIYNPDMVIFSIPKSPLKGTLWLWIPAAVILFLICCVVIIDD